jgi:hypothetical protein
MRSLERKFSRRAGSEYIALREEAVEDDTRTPIGEIRILARKGVDSLLDLTAPFVGADAGI